MLCRQENYALTGQTAKEDTQLMAHIIDPSKAPEIMKKARYEKSCGAVVVCTDGGRRRYLLTRSLRGVWGFPKGHVEGNETEHETALREIREETGLDVSFAGDFRETDAYLIVRKGRQPIDKHVVFFLAGYEGQTPVPQASEIARIALLDYEKAMKKLTFEGTKRVLAAAQRFLDEQAAAGEKDA